MRKFILIFFMSFFINSVNACEEKFSESTIGFLNWLGKDSKMVFLGDERQQDSRGGNGLTFLMDHFQDMWEVGCVQFNKSDVVRNPLIAKIERVFDSLQIEAR